MNRSRKTLLIALAALLPQAGRNASAQQTLNADFTQIKQGLAAGFVDLAKNVNPEVRQAGKANSWDQARKACADLKPGTWDLPTDSEYFGLVVRGVVDVGIKLAGENANYYPMWIRAGSEDKNKVHLSGKGLIIGLQDGKGEDMFPMDVSPAGVAELKKGIAELQQELDARRHRSEEDEKKIAEALAGHRKANPGVWLNPDVPHPGVLSDEANRLLEIPSKQNLLKAQETLKGLFEAVKDGYPVHCVGR